MDVYDDGGDIFGVPTLIPPTDGKSTDMAIDTWTIGKVQVVEYPTQLPSKCACCGAVPNGGGEFANTRYFVDFGLELAEYGVVYICTDCYVESAQRIGYIGPSKAQELAFQIDSLTQENINLRSQVESLRSVSDAIASLHAVTNSSDSSVLPIKANAKTKSGTNSSSDEPRPDDVSSTTSLDDALAI